MKYVATHSVIGALLDLVVAAAPARAAGTNAGGCQLDQANGRIKHVVYLQFDNVHLRRDNPNVPSDLEQPLSVRSAGASYVFVGLLAGRDVTVDTLVEVPPVRKITCLPRTFLEVSLIGRSAAERELSVKLV